MKHVTAHDMSFDTNFEPTKDFAAVLDKQDTLARFREEFYLRDGEVYLDGNSLGLLSKRAEQALLSVLDSWRRYGIDGWSEGTRPWFYLSERLGDQLAPLIGANPGEVIATGSTTINLHQLMATFFRPTGGRVKILADSLNFPSDVYALKSQLQLHGLNPERHLVQVESEDGLTLDEGRLMQAMTDEVAVAILPSVLYRSGQLLNLERLTKAAHERGILIGFDLAHSIGALPHRLSDWGVDFAFWCNYKYLNSGPGSVAGLYVNQVHHSQAPGLAGWFSSNKEAQFDMEHTLTPAATAGAYQIGTPHILSLAPLLGSLELFHEAGILAIRKKSLRLTRYMMDLINHQLTGMGFSFANPLDDAHRGGHVALVHQDAVRISKALKAHQVIPDFRPPNVIRLAPIALYTSFSDVYEGVARLRHIMETRQYENYGQDREVIA